MEENLSFILRDMTALRLHPDGSNIFRMDDPELLNFPVAYLSEPGYWYPSDSEAAGLRDYLAWGGSNGSMSRTRCSTPSLRSTRSRCRIQGDSGSSASWGSSTGSTMGTTRRTG